MTRSNLNTLIDTNLANGSNITPTEHREVEKAIADYVDQQDSLKVDKATGQSLATDAEKSAWNAKQPAGDYATNTALTNGLATKAATSHSQSADTLTDGTTNKAFLATERTKLEKLAFIGNEIDPQILPAIDFIDCDVDTDEDGTQHVDITSKVEDIVTGMNLGGTASASDIIAILTANGVTVAPPAPTWVSQDNTTNTAVFTPAPGYAANIHEYRKRIGGTWGSWIVATSTTISGLTEAIANGDVQLRVSAGTNRNAGAVLASTIAYTSSGVVASGTLENINFTENHAIKTGTIWDAPFDYNPYMEKSDKYLAAGQSGYILFKHAAETDNSPRPMRCVFGFKSTNETGADSTFLAGITIDGSAQIWDSNVQTDDYSQMDSDLGYKIARVISQDGQTSTITLSYIRANSSEVEKHTFSSTTTGNLYVLANYRAGNPGQVNTPQIFNGSAI